MSSVEGALRAASAAPSSENESAGGIGDPDASSVHGSSEAVIKGPQDAAESSCSSGVYESPIYINLGSKCATPEEKLAAGYKLVEAQKKDLEKMSNKLLEVQTQLGQKEQSIEQLYVMVEQVSPMLNQLSSWNEKLTTDEERLKAELKSVKYNLGIDGADPDSSDNGSVANTPQEDSGDMDAPRNGDAESSQS